MSFADVATLLLPAGGGTVADVGERWDTALPPRGVWGREPTWMPAGPELVRYAARRERALVRLRARGRLVHRWSPSNLATPGLAWLRAGALVELGPRAPRVLDVVASDAGLDRRPRRLYFGLGGQLRARADGAVLRVARAGSPVDPAPAAEALERLAALPRVPRLLGCGVAGAAAWTSESLLPGGRAKRLTAPLIEAVTDFCLTLPCAPSPPTAFDAEIASLAELLPRYAIELRAMRERTAPALGTLPSVLRHGDMWLGNLLVDRGTLTGVVDWDVWHPAGVPGTDLLHLVASAHAFATRRSVGELMADRPWEQAWFARPAARYWRELGVAPAPEVLEAVGVAWWAMHTHANLRRHPQVASDPKWLARGVEPMLGT